MRPGTRRATHNPSPGVLYWLNDEFITDRAGGAANNTAAEPGPGLRHTTELDGSITISNGLLNLSGQTTVVLGELKLYYSLPFSREEGRTFEFRVRHNATGTCLIGLFNNTTMALGDANHAFYINGTAFSIRNDPSNTSIGVATASTWVTLRIVLKATGCDYYVNDKLVGSGTSYTTTPLYLGVSTGALNIDVDYIRVWGGSDFGHLCITFDDSRANMYAGYEYAIARGVMGTIYCITADVAGGSPSLTLAQLQTIDASGWAIGSHTTTGVQLATLTEAQQETELDAARVALEGMGLTKASRHVAYPNNSYNADTMTAMAATGQHSGRIVTPPTGGVDKTTNIYQVNLAYAAVLTATTVAQLQTAIRTAIASGKYGFLLFHGLADTPTTGEWSTANWQAFIDWLVAAGVKTRTILDYYNYHG